MSVSSDLQTLSSPKPTDSNGYLHEVPHSSAATRLAAHINKRFVDGFTPAYFASVMGTGISANILHNFAFPAHWLRVCSAVMGVVSVTLFGVLMALFAVALVRNKTLFRRIHFDPATAPAMGCFVMGFTSLVMYLHNVLGRRGITAVWALWWVSTAASLYTAFVTFYLSTIGKHRKQKTQADPASLSMTYLLPVVTLTVASSAGGLIGPDLSSVRLQVVTMVVSLIMWAIAMSLAFVILTVNYWRFFVHKIPNSGQVLTMFLPIGYVGQGAYAILLFARNCTVLLMENEANVAASSYTSFLHDTAQKNNVSTANLAAMLSVAIMAVCTLAAVTSMAFGYFLTIIAFLALFSKVPPFAVKHNEAFVYRRAGTDVRRRFVGFLRFQRGYWSMTFPLGTMALANGELHRLYNGLVAFQYVYAIYAVIVLMVTMGCLIGVVYRAFAVAKDSLWPEEKSLA